MDEDDQFDHVFTRIAGFIEQARATVARSINTSMVQAYWHVGRELVETEQAGANRATYGEGLLKQLSKRLVAQFGAGFGLANLKQIRKFYLVYPQGSAIGQTASSLLPKGQTVSGLSAESPAFSQGLSWSHYVVLTRIANDDARRFYEIEAAREAWSVRELERPVGAQLFERLTRNKSPEEVRILAQVGQSVAKPSDVIKDPFVLEFLNLQERPHFQERDLEQAIIDRLETFLLEMGKGFCFVGRQKRLTVDGDHFYVDLVFYNRLLRCFILIDLKLGKLTHQDLGQMMMYVNYFDRTQLAEHEAKTVGIVLCSEANQTMAKITLPDDSNIMAATYRLYIPSEAELQAELTREREDIERAFRLAEADADERDR